MLVELAKWVIITRTSFGNTGRESLAAIRACNFHQIIVSALNA